MTGARISFEFRHEAFTAALQRLDISNPARRLKLMKSIALGLRSATEDRFRSGTTPAGAPFQALNPLYAATRKQMPILQQQGFSSGLADSITAQTARDQVTVGSNKEYAAIHQFGGVIRPKNKKALAFRLGGRVVLARSVHIPARPYLGFGAADEEAVLYAIDTLLPGGR